MILFNEYTYTRRRFRVNLLLKNVAVQSSKRKTTNFPSVSIFFFFFVFSTYGYRSLNRIIWYTHAHTHTRIQIPAPSRPNRYGRRATREPNEPTNSAVRLPAARSSSWCYGRVADGRIIIIKMGVRRDRQTIEHVSAVPRDVCMRVLLSLD